MGERNLRKRKSQEREREIAKKKNLRCKGIERKKENARKIERDRGEEAETERMLRSGSVENVEEGERMKTNNINNLRIFTTSSRREER